MLHFGVYIMLNSLIEKLFFCHVDVSPYGRTGVRGEYVRNLSPLYRSGASYFCLSRPLWWNSGGSGSAPSGKCASGGSMEKTHKMCMCIKGRQAAKQKHTHTHTCKHYKYTAEAQVDLVQAVFTGSILPLCAPPTVPTPALFSKAVTAAALIMKGKIFYSDLLI